jgi:hypothetical protein
MHLSPARWTTALAAAALIALPGAALAQSNPTQNPPAQNPPTQTQQQPPTSQTPAQQPTTPQSTSPASMASGQVDQAAAKRHLTEARDALSQLTSMPEAPKLQGEARTKLSELISNFNALITTPTDWRAADAKVNDSLVALLGPDTDQAQNGAGAGDVASASSATSGTTGTTGTAATGTTGTAGTSGTAGSTDSAVATGSPVQIDPALRGKLIEFRTHLKEFEKAAGGANEASPSTPPSASPDSPSKPATPATAVSGATGTSGSVRPNPESEQTKPSMTAAAPTAPTGGTDQNATDQHSNAAAQSELAAIDAILAKSKTGELTKAETTELKRHVDALHALIK